MVICLERGADLHMAQLMPPPLTVSCFSKIQIGFTFLVLAHPGSPGKRAVKRVWCGGDGDNPLLLIHHTQNCALVGMVEHVSHVCSFLFLKCELY